LSLAQPSSADKPAEAGIIPSMKAKWILTWLFLGLMVLVQAGCREATVLPGTSTPFPGGQFTPYQTRVPGQTAVQPTLNLPTFTPLPTITPTPRTYVVKAGDDMGGIALRYRVPVKDLISANPTVNPRLMRVGTVLIIPGSAPDSAPAAQTTPTRQPVALEAVRCLPDPAGGVWCFTRVHNQGGTALINVSVMLRLVDVNGKEYARQSLSLPLDILAVDATLPLAAFFAPPLPAGMQAAVELVSALPASSASEHYPAVKIQNIKTEIATDGVSALASGQAALVNAKDEAAQLVVLAVAYTNGGAIVGLRRWDYTQTVKSAVPVAFDIRVYSLGDPIVRIDLFAEARK
jgi:LysM repeat protein